MNNSTPDLTKLPEGLWQNDLSLRRASQLLDQLNGRVRAVTFDFFDTLVWRLAGVPTDVFGEVGQRLRQDGSLPGHISNRDYEALRRQAEAKTRSQQALRDKSREDISLAEIVAELKSIVPQTEKAAQAELQTEMDFCLINPVMIEFAREMRRRGLKIFVVSDVYFSPDQLRSILRANHLEPEFFHDIFTSSNAGVCKWSGKLFTHVLKQIGLKPEEILHIGDNFQSDVIGAQQAGVRACHYELGSNEFTTILEREGYLLGGQSPVASATWLRLLAARNFPGHADTDFFGRAGAMLMGPLLARYAGWACEQFVAAGVRKVGAFMREGELLGHLLQREAAAMGHALDLAPLYANRKSTDLAAIGELSAAKLLDWVGRRQTLKLRTILEHFGLQPSELRNLPFSPEEKISTRERLLQVGKFLFEPAITQRIEKRSAAERRKVIDYLKPWLDSGDAFGVCDIGYNATAQMQLQRIFDMEGVRTKMVGCYLVTTEMAARRMLDGIDVRHFLGSFGQPGFNNFAFLRSPAFMEQSLVASCGTTLGYQRDPSGKVSPVLDEMRFPDELLRRQRAFKDGVLHYQTLWLHFRAQKPALLDGKTEASRRVLADIDFACAPILARATAFPTQQELAHFSSLPLDDYYFAEGFKTISGAKEREVIRTKGFAGSLNDQGVLWPQAANQQLNPRAASDFFSYGRAMLLCQCNPDNNGVQPSLTVIVEAANPDRLRSLFGQLVKNVQAGLNCDIFLLLEEDNKECAALATEFAGGLHRLNVFNRPASQTVARHFNQALYSSGSPWILLLDDSLRLTGSWESAVLAPCSPETGAVVASPDASCLLVRRLALIESLGFADNLSTVGAKWHLLSAMRRLGWKINASAKIIAEAPPQKIPVPDRNFLAGKFSDFETFAAEIQSHFLPVSLPDVALDWIGSFLDFGSLSHVNRELTRALAGAGKIRLRRVNAPALAQDAALPPALKPLSELLAPRPSPDAQVTVRHAWPPDWQRPAQGKLVVIQPWEFGSLPTQWVGWSGAVDEFWLPSEYVRRLYIDSGVPADKVFVVPNGVDPEKFHPAVAPMSLATQKKFKFLFVGGTIGRKGIDLLLQAYLGRFTQADDVCLVIKDFGGKSAYRGQTMESQIRTLQSQPNAPEILYLNDELPPESLPGLYTACQCLILPYRGEGFGLPVLEAMACGLPVMVTAGGATDDFVRDEFAWRLPATVRKLQGEVSGLKLVDTGWMLEPDVAQLGVKMREVFGNPEAARARGLLASRHAHQFYSWKNSAAIVAQRLSALVKAPAGSQPPPVVPAAVPSVAQVGRLTQARELLAAKNFAAAWQAATTAIARRPFHPEAFLLLAEIALAAGDGGAARKCAQHARNLAPGWAPARQFLKRPLKAGASPQWLVAPVPIQKNPPAGKLSVCLIVKNEERFIAQCLKSIRDIAGQIVVVDTGSTDRTVEIAREFGAEISSLPWADDFAAARNAALEQATGDWVLVLDADEELPPAQHQKLLAEMKNPSILGYRLPLVNVGQEAEGCSYVPRLYRNAPGIFYSGRIHEQVFPSIIPMSQAWGVRTALGASRLLHYGYAPELVQDRKKVERNLKLLRLAVTEHPADANLAMNLGLEVVRSGDVKGGIVHYRQAFDMMAALPPQKVVPELREVLLTQFTSQLYKIRGHAEVFQVLNSPLAKKGGLTASLHLTLGLSCFELGEYGLAADNMRQCLAKRDQPCLSPINVDIHGPAPHHCLALCLSRLNDLAGAEKAFQAAAAAPGPVESAKLDYAKFLSDAKRPLEALQQLNEIVATNAKHARAWKAGAEIALGSPEFLEFACDWTGEAIRALPEDTAIVAHRAEALMLHGDAAEAAKIWQRLTAGQPEPRQQAALILCEVAADAPVHKLDAETDELTVTRSFIEWYQKLISVRANTLVKNINDRLDKLSQVLPTAAQMIEAALAEAGTCVPA